MEEKKQLRKEIARKLEAITMETIQVSNARLLDKLLDLREYTQASALFCYVSMEKEPDTRRLIAHALASGKRVGVPLCTGKGIMEAREIKALTDLTQGHYGILEPKSSCPVMIPEEFDFAIIPCISCGHNRARLGHGGGYYDRYMGRLRCTKMCLCYEVLTCEAIPLEEHDLPVDMLLTEEGVFLG